ncbi:hypothetical protein HELRODRAFT_183046 [Helobdella robusta]|uniref:Uncharacterized protein n=1 Tax=Helobdella robusta TaxID=6412 RepID=T1FJ37_HELRO|nr:hypothetical protein HELRODRAFT_183046 [Helobdella robusta]ESN89925.1 hypothetical protein HELRODRAFT_183046 [Helobdella robusta]
MKRKMQDETLFDNYLDECKDKQQHRLHQLLQQQQQQTKRQLIENEITDKPSNNNPDIHYSQPIRDQPKLTLFNSTSHLFQLLPKHLLSHFYSLSPTLLFPRVLTNTTDSYGTENSKKYPQAISTFTLYNQLNRLTKVDDGPKESEQTNIDSIRCNAGIDSIRCNANIDSIPCNFGIDSIRCNADIDSIRCNADTDSKRCNNCIESERCNSFNGISLVKYNEFIVPKDVSFEEPFKDKFEKTVLIKTEAGDLI